MNQVGNHTARVSICTCVPVYFSRREFLDRFLITSERVLVLVQTIDFTHRFKTFPVLDLFASSVIALQALRALDKLSAP
jgi:hypothetical protein